MTGEMTLKDLKLMAINSTPIQIMIDYLTTRDKSIKLSCVERGIDFAIREMIKAPHLYQDMSEDQLTNALISTLLGMGFKPTHDTQIGGHCDIVIQSDDGFLWIGEAKKHTSYKWLLQGFNQLDTRYSTGMPGQDSGDIIIFIFQERIDLVIKKWTETLAAERTDVVVQVCTQDPTRRISSHPHTRTGRIFRTRHIPVSLYFAPRDKN